ncbi:hypothetical protein KIN20_001352 [Parelaphostrongylus tenuis]|uniref:Uncharacterized protein n=1 Tax=Parelaphostrongylus tenuis TaxID=148309 RepID=A0AAD5MCG2_PARTN|nr:hypothetical protein KIN20_001352 [Parelaphostrongylus tenuis]
MKSTNLKKSTARKSAAVRWTRNASQFRNLDLEGKLRSGRPTKLNNENLTATLEDEPSSSACKLAAELCFSYNCANSSPPA